MLISQVTKLYRLTLQEWRLLIISASGLPFLGALLYMFGYGNTIKILSMTLSENIGRLEGNIYSWDMPKSAVEIVKMVSLAAKRGPYSANCLEQSLLIWWMLNRIDIPASIKIGVKKEAKGLLAHAWVECNGNVLNDIQTISDSYVPFDADSTKMGARII